MKVYVVIACDCEGDYIYGIYSTKEKAEEIKRRCEILNVYDVQQFDCDKTFYRIKEYLVY